MPKISCSICKKLVYKFPSRMKSHYPTCSVKCKHKMHSRMLVGRFRNENSSQWKGDRVGYTALHNWVRRRLKKPERCSECKVDSKLDLANKSGLYKRILSDWEWLCRKCHMAKDGRMKRRDKHGRFVYQRRQLWRLQPRRGVGVRASSLHPAAQEVHRLRSFHNLPEVLRTVGAHRGLIGGDLSHGLTRPCRLGVQLSGNSG